MNFSKAVIFALFETIVLSLNAFALEVGQPLSQISNASLVHFSVASESGSAPNVSSDYFESGIYYALGIGARANLDPGVSLGGGGVRLSIRGKSGLNEPYALFSGIGFDVSIQGLTSGTRRSPTNSAETNGIYFGLGPELDFDVGIPEVRTFFSPFFRFDAFLTFGDNRAENVAASKVFYGFGIRPCAGLLFDFGRIWLHTGFDFPSWSYNEGTSDVQSNTSSFSGSSSMVPGFFVDISFVLWKTEK